MGTATASSTVTPAPTQHLLAGARSRGRHRDREDQVRARRALVARGGRHRPALHRARQQCMRLVRLRQHRAQHAQLHYQQIKGYVHGMLSHKLYLVKHRKRQAFSHKQQRLLHRTRMLFIAPTAPTLAHNATNVSTSTCARSSSTAPRCATSAPPGLCEIVCFLPGGGPSPRRSTISSQNTSKHVACACATHDEETGEVELPWDCHAALQRCVKGVAFQLSSYISTLFLAQRRVAGQHLECDGPLMLLLQIACAGI